MFIRSRRPGSSDNQHRLGGARHRRPGRRSWWLLGVGGAALVIGTLALTGQTAAPGQNAPGSGTAPKFMLDNVRLGQSPVALSDFGGRPVVLNFFASWCVPCRREMPALEAVHRRIGARVAFVGVDHQDSRPAALLLMEKTGVTYPCGFDPSGQLALDYGLIGIPTTLFVASDGRIIEKHTGEFSEAKLRATVDRLFPA